MVELRAISGVAPQTPVGELRAAPSWRVAGSNDRSVGVRYAVARRGMRGMRGMRKSVTE
jgi:hypothetical protein